MEGAALVEDRAGIKFGVELYMSWDAPDVVLDIHSEGVVPLGSVPDVVGLVGRRSGLVWSPIRWDWTRTSMTLRLWPPAVATCDLSSHGVASAGSGDNAGRRQETFSQTKPSPCVYCGRVIKCDMYRHVAMFHLDLAQLWRCPVSCCTVWKGNPQDCMDHVRGTHDVPWIVKTANMEQFVYAVDCSSTDVVGFIEGGTFGDLDRHSAVW